MEGDVKKIEIFDPNLPLSHKRYKIWP